MFKKFILGVFILFISSNILSARPIWEEVVFDLGAGASVPMGEKIGLGGSGLIGLQTSFLNYYVGSNYYTYQITNDDIENDALAEAIGTGSGSMLDLFVRLEYPIPTMMTKYNLKLYGGLDVGESYFTGIYKDSSYMVETEMIGYMAGLYAAVGYSVSQRTEVLFRLGGVYRLINYELDKDTTPSFTGGYATLGLKFYLGDAFTLNY